MVHLIASLNEHRDDSSLFHAGMYAKMLRQSNLYTQDRITSINNLCTMAMRFKSGLSWPQLINDCGSILKNAEDRVQAYR